MPNEAVLAGTTALDDAIGRAGDALLRQQHSDGHWVFELEADATIPAEYVLLEHFLDRIDPELEAKIGVYLRDIQGAHGGWPLFHDGAFDLSASVKAYFALKAIGDDTGCAAHGARKGRDPGGGRRGTRQRVHPRAVGAVRSGSLAGGAGDAAGDHAPAAMVPVPSVEGVVLVAYRDRAAAGADGAATQWRGTHAMSAFRNCFAHRPSRCVTGYAGRIAQPGGGHSSSSWTAVLRVVQPAFPRRSRRQRDCQGGALCHRAAEWRRWAGRHLSGDRQQRDDVRHAWLCRPIILPPRSHGVRSASCW